MLQVFNCIDEWHRDNGHMGQERTWGYCKEKYWNIAQVLVKHYCETCPACMKKNPITQPAKGSRKPIRSRRYRDRFQIDLIDFRKLRKRDPFGVLMRWVMTIKDHSTGLTYLCALPRKRPHLIAYKLQEIFGIIGYPKIFHTDNGKEFTAKVVLKFLREMNPHIYAVTGRPRRPQDQGSVESMNKLVKRILGTVLTERRLAGDNPNWTEVLGMVSATINSQHGRGKDDVSSFEAVYGQVLNHDMSCSKAEARECWTLPQLLKVTNDAEFAEYAGNNYILDEDSTDAAEQDDSLGYFSDEELQDDEKEEVTDDEFYSLLNEDVLLENDTAIKVGNAAVGGDATAMKVGNAAVGGDANYEDYHQTFEVEEQHHTYMKTPELENKKHFKSDEVDSPDKSDEVDSPDVTFLSEYLRTPPPKEKVNYKDDDEIYDVWDESWVTDTTVDQRIKTSLTAGFSACSIAEAWKRQSQLNRKVDNDDCIVGRLYCNLCARTGMTGILIPNTRYENELRFSTKWYISGFIAGFAAMVQHDAHFTTPTYKNSDCVLMVFTPYPDNLVKVILPFGDKTHFVSVV